MLCLCDTDELCTGTMLAGDLLPEAEYRSDDMDLCLTRDGRVFNLSRTSGFFPSMLSFAVAVATDTCLPLYCLPSFRLLFSCSLGDKFLLSVNRGLRLL